MDVLIIGSGGREYSIGAALAADKKVDRIYFSPGNGATDELGRNIPYGDLDELAEFAEANGIDLTIVGPEAPLVDGIVDIFKKRGLTIFGPDSKAARLEGSKVFMKEFLKRHSIPTARYIKTDSIEEAGRFIRTLTPPIVVKADGLCAGKGVIIAMSEEEALKSASEMLDGSRFGEAGSTIVIEEYLDGYELSVFAICDGKEYVLLPAAQDHKRLLDGDEGPNTGGMGAYVPTPLANGDIYSKLEERVVVPTLRGMEKEGMPFSGVLFMGVMVVKGEPMILEYNVRFGDPECEEIMPLLKSSAFDLFYSAATGSLSEYSLEFENRYAVGVVAASANYPYGSSEKAPITIEDIDDELAENSMISYAGVSRGEDGRLYADGGRVLVSVGLGGTIAQARDRAYALMSRIRFEGMQYRKDIAYQALAE